MLQGFTPFNFDEGVPFVSITKNGVTFNKGVVKKLDCPQYVLLLINTQTKQIAIQVCSKEVDRAVAFFNDEKKKNAFSVRWNGRDLINTITLMTGWNLDKEGFKAEGILIPEEQAILFDLNNAIRLE